MRWSPTFGPYRALDTTVALAKRLQDDCGARIQTVDARHDVVSIELTIPTPGGPSIRRLHRGLWITFVARNVESRKERIADLEGRIAVHRAGVEEARALAEANRRLLACQPGAL